VPNENRIERYKYYPLSRRPTKLVDKTYLRVETLFLQIYRFNRTVFSFDYPELVRIEKYQAGDPRAERPRLGDHRIIVSYKYEH